VLTRIEIDGFKTFRDFALDLPPFLVVLGRNGTGKSNLSDALRFLSRLASEPVVEAAQDVRGDLSELFHRDSMGSSDQKMRFAVEALLDSRVTDAFGESVPVSAVRVRYELTIELRIAQAGSRPFVKSESVRALPAGEDRRPCARSADPVRPRQRDGLVGHRNDKPEPHAFRAETRT
jgi:predicted ATPase